MKRLRLRSAFLMSLLLKIMIFYTKSPWTLRIDMLVSLLYSLRWTKKLLAPFFSMDLKVNTVQAQRSFRDHAGVRNQSGSKMKLVLPMHAQNIDIQLLFVSSACQRTVKNETSGLAGRQKIQTKVGCQYLFHTWEH